MASRFSLEAILSLTDDLTGPYKRTTNNVKGLNMSLTNSFKSLGSSITRGLKTAAVVGGAAIVGGLALATKEFVAMETAITKAGAKFIDVDVTADNFKDTLMELQQTAREVGRDTQFSAVDAAGALDKFAMAGINSRQAMALLKGTTDLAVVADTDLTTAVDIATDSLGAFNLMTEDTAKLTENLSRVSDVLAKTSVATNTDLQQLFETVVKGGPAFTAAGQDIETFAAIAGRMASSGIKASEAGTAMATAMSRLAKNDQALGMLSELGVTVTDQEGNFRNMIDILGDLEAATKSMGEQQRAAAIATIFGDRAWKAFLPLLTEGVDQSRKLEETLRGATGTTEQLSGAIGKSLGGRLAALKSAVTEMGFTFVSVFQEKAGPTLDRLTEMIKNVDLGAVAVKLDEFVGRILDNLPQIKEQFIQILPEIKAFAEQMSMIVGYIATAIGKFGELTSGPVFKALKFGMQGGVIGAIQRRAEDRAASEQRVEEAVPRITAQQEAQVEDRRRLEELLMRQQNDVFLHAPAGYGLSAQPGGAPQMSLNLGEQ